MRASRTDWALLLLRLPVGGTALLHSVPPLLAAHGPITFARAGMWAQDLGIAVAGGFVLIGLWLPVAAGVLAGLIGWPLVVDWIRGGAFLGEPDRLFRCLVTAASAIGGSGRWGVGK